MKHLFRFLSLLLALMLFTSGALAAVSDNINLDSIFPIVKNPVKAHIGFVPAWSMVTSEYDEDKFWEIRFLRDVTNMDLEFTMIDPSTANESLNLMLASGDIPDLVLGYPMTASEVVNYGVTQGLIRPVEDLLVYMPTFSKILEETPSIRAGITAPDGHIYTFPTMSYGDYTFQLRTWINQVWLDNLGLKNPTTVDELYEVLKAFKEQDANGNGDPNDEIPWSGGWAHGFNWLENMKMAYGLPQTGLISFDYTDGKDGSTIVFSPATDAFKDMLKMMHKMWNEGLIDPDYFTQSEIQAYAKCAANQVGIIGATSPDALSIPNPKDFVSMNALVDKPGETPVVAGYAPLRDICRAFISADVDDETAAALANLVDYYYTDEAYITNWYGPELGSEYDYDNNGMMYIPELKGWNYKDAGDTMWWNYKITHFNFWEVPGTTNVGNKFIDQSWAEKYPDSVVGKYLADNGLYLWWQQSLIDAALKYEVPAIPAMFMSEDDNERIAVLKTQLDTYVENMIANFVTGEADIDAEWDTFLTTLEGYGMSEYVKLYNDYYDIFKANMK